MLVLSLTSFAEAPVSAIKTSCSTTFTPHLEKHGNNRLDVSFMLLLLLLLLLFWFLSVPGSCQHVHPKLTQKLTRSNERHAQKDCMQLVQHSLANIQAAILGQCQDMYAPRVASRQGLRSPTFEQCHMRKTHRLRRTNLYSKMRRKTEESRRISNNTKTASG